MFELHQNINLTKMHDTFDKSEWRVGRIRTTEPFSLLL